VARASHLIPPVSGRDGQRDDHLVMPMPPRREKI